MRDLFGWSRAVDRASIAPAILVAAEAADVLEWRSGGVAARLRVSTIAGRLFAHSAWPTHAADSVFLGPDSQRFTRFLLGHLPPARARLAIVDIGTGAGVGGITAAAALPGATLTLTDINAAALTLARANAAHAGLVPTLVHTNILDAAPGPFDLALANPPFLIDPARRAYRHGGAMLGGALGLEIARAALVRLAPGGRLILYTASAIVAGRDALAEALRAAAASHGADLALCELDPDVFGEELARPAYAAAERIALLGAVFTLPR